MLSLGLDQERFQGRGFMDCSRRWSRRPGWRLGRWRGGKEYKVLLREIGTVVVVFVVAVVRMGSQWLRGLG